MFSFFVVQVLLPFILKRMESSPQTSKLMNMPYI